MSKPEAPAAVPSHRVVRRALVAGLVLSAAAIAAMAIGASGPTKPTRLANPAGFSPGAGQPIAERACLICHSPMLVTQQNKDSTGWEKSLVQMEKWGAPLTPAEHDTLRRYLVTHYGPRPAGQ